MPKNKKVGIKERAARQVAYDTAEMKPGMGTKLKRGTAMIGALLGSAFAPGDTKSDAQIRTKRDAGTKKRATTKVKKKKTREKDAAKRREPFDVGKAFKGVQELSDARTK